MTTLWRLVWALPLVLGVGVVGMLVLRRFIAPTRNIGQELRRLTARESLSLSDQTRVYLIDLDGASYLIVESVQHAELHGVPSQSAIRASQRSAYGAPRLRSFYRAERR
jgi:flagellar biogenesis protein FliO